MGSGAGVVGVLGEEVDRNGQVDGAFAAGVGLGVGAAQVERNLRGVGRLGGPLHDGPRHADLVDILKGLAIAPGVERGCR